MPESYPIDEYTRYGSLRMHVRTGRRRPSGGAAARAGVHLPHLGPDGADIGARLLGNCRGPAGARRQRQAGERVRLRQRGRGCGGAAGGRALSGRCWWDTRGAPTWLWSWPQQDRSCCRGLCSSTGGTIDASARYDRLEDALVQMAPPEFRGVTPAQVLGARPVRRPVGHADRTARARPPRRSSWATSRPWTTVPYGPSYPATTTCASSRHYGTTTRASSTRMRPARC